MLTIESIATGVSSVAPSYNVNRVELFGSYAQETQTESSDVDLLVEFKQDAVSLLTLSALQQGIEEKLGVPVDLIHAPIPQHSFLEIGKSVLLYEA